MLTMKRGELARAKHSAKYDSDLMSAVGANIIPISQRRKLRYKGVPPPQEHSETVEVP